MARYIDADKYVEYLEKEICSKCIDEVCGACGLDSARWIAEEFPTADVVPKSEVANEIIQDIAKVCAVKEFENIDVSIGYASAVNDILKELVAVKRKYEGL